AYGSLSVVLVFYLIGVGLSEPQTGLLLTLTLAGDTVVSLFLTTRADRIGRRRMLIVGASLMAAAGLVFASTQNLWLLFLAGTIAFRATFAGLSGLGRSRDVVMKLSALFALDAFGGGFVVQSFAAYWFYLRFGVNPETLGVIFFWANIFAGISALLASRLASRFGLINTMVDTHLPSNILLILVPLMPSLSLAVLVLL